LITDNEKLVLFAEDVNQAKTHIFTGIRGLDGLSIEEKLAHNLDTVRLHKAGGDTSKRKMYMMYFGTTFRHWETVSFLLNQMVVFAVVLYSCVRTGNSADMHGDDCFY